MSQVEEEAAVWETESALTVWIEEVTYKMNAITDILAKLSDLHQPMGYLGVVYCKRCMIEWPCPEGKVFEQLRD